MSRSVLPMFSSKSFIVSGLTFMTLRVFFKKKKEKPLKSIVATIGTKFLSHHLLCQNMAQLKSSDHRLFFVCLFYFVLFLEEKRKASEVDCCYSTSFLLVGEMEITQLISAICCQEQFRQQLVAPEVSGQG